MKKMENDEKQEEQNESEIVKALKEKYEKEIEAYKKKLADKDVVIKELINNPAEAEKKKDDEAGKDELTIDSYIKGVVGNIENKLKGKKKGM